MVGICSIASCWFFVKRDSVGACQWPLVSSLSPAIFRGPVGFFALETLILFARPTYHWPA